VLRSLITLKALIHQSTGGLVAAPTTSLPEVIGGSSNWDYRYCWLRDATFTIIALLNAGYHDDAIAWRDWMLRAIAASPDRLRIMYRVDGSRHLPEWTVSWLPGFAGSRPVRIGNDAAAQEQIDVHGELIEAMHLFERAGISRPSHGLALERALVDRLETVWTDPGHGLWEARGEPKHYVYSKVMAWVGIDRFLKGSKPANPEDRDLFARLNALRQAMHQEICQKGYSTRRGHFVQHYGSEKLDASLLLLAPIGFLPIDDPRIRGTIEAVQRELTEDGLVHRKPPAESGGEGAFLPCSCWLADCLSMLGQDQQAAALLERVLEVRNDLGLLAEEYDLQRRQLCGNFPQALSHLALVNTALGLSGPVLVRAGA
jgi:GH15 family glucan-1,4-alpha-glucosidase